MISKRLISSTSVCFRMILERTKTKSIVIGGGISGLQGAVFPSFLKEAADLLLISGFYIERLRRRGPIIERSGLCGDSCAKKKKKKKKRGRPA